VLSPLPFAGRPIPSRLPRNRSQNAQFTEA
jgi:hypothetical protein